ncbi:lipoate--protein ligase family protein [Planococcus sp. N028]|uniref:Lipoate--protein ligase family protein n=1 Tax=Planococcus shixiaomingii TaxID=3058393 RepID=A0ABT8N438_9BACL|nr:MULTISPECIES: lipoate--protein ligase family protein [unclassified Planococcus (in: firmicutes)]MDN7242649.1 lipoate--protein ligase family protein [Planococcus sp. N028]WKA55720.1 lipoate--protein ligase family protein [Planococcus sp. N022]
MKDTWLFVDSGHCAPSFNMALDEALLNWHSLGKIPPVLRFYGWEPAGISVGFFQKVDGQIDLEGARKYGIELVRRQTGGKAVLHDQELTYSVIVSEEHPAMPKSIKEAYLVLSKGLLEGYKELKIDAEFATPGSAGMKTGSAVCFEEPSWYELVIEGKKAAGSAQTRKSGVILQHGSIPLEIDEIKLFDLFLYPSERAKERARKAFGNRAVAINDVLPSAVSFEQAKAAFKKGFEQGLDIDLQPYELPPLLLEEVSILEKKYKSEDWNNLRERKEVHQP